MRKNETNEEIGKIVCFFLFLCGTSGFVGCDAQQIADALLCIGQPVVYGRDKQIWNELNVKYEVLSETERTLVISGTALEELQEIFERDMTKTDKTPLESVSKPWKLRWKNQSEPFEREVDFTIVSPQLCYFTDTTDPGEQKTSAYEMKSMDFYDRLMEICLETEKTFTPDVSAANLRLGGFVEDAPSVDNVLTNKEGETP